MGLAVPGLFLLVLGFSFGGSGVESGPIAMGALLVAMALAVGWLSFRPGSSEPPSE